jgi:hypothetical protein
MAMEGRVREAELIATRMVEEAERRVIESEQFKSEMFKAKMLEKIARDRLTEIARPSSQLRSPQEMDLELQQNFSNKQPSYQQGRLVFNGLTMNSDQLTAEIERERYFSKRRKVFLLIHIFPKNKYFSNFLIKMIFLIYSILFNKN